METLKSNPQNGDAAQWYTWYTDVPHAEIHRTDEVISYEVLLSLTQPKGKGQQKGTANRG